MLSATTGNKHMHMKSITQIWCDDSQSSVCVSVQGRKNHFYWNYFLGENSVIQTISKQNTLIQSIVSKYGIFVILWQIWYINNWELTEENQRVKRQFLEKKLNHNYSPELSCN